MFKQKNGITLVALIITVIILIIIAGISINFIFGNEGIFNRTQYAVDKYKNAQEEEETLIAKISNSINSNRDDNETIALLVKKIEELEKQVKGANPTGTIIAFYGDTAPDRIFSM